MTIQTIKLSKGYATFSADGEYRYVLGRHVPDVSPWAPMLRFIMLNPSKAGGDKDDATIRRCKGFAVRWGFQKFEVSNLYARIATDPKLLHAEGSVGPQNDDWLEQAFELAASRQGDKVVVAWGGFEHEAIAERVAVVQRLAKQHDQKLWCLGTTASGAPRHPLRLSYDTKLQEWPCHVTTKAA
jgi:hypothetical protein